MEKYSFYSWKKVLSGESRFSVKNNIYSDGADILANSSERQV